MSRNKAPQTIAAANGIGGDTAFGAVAPPVYLSATMDDQRAAENAVAALNQAINRRDLHSFPVEAGKGLFSAADGPRNRLRAS
jgi:hypothetical protein